MMIATENVNVIVNANVKQAEDQLNVNVNENRNVNVNEIVATKEEILHIVPDTESVDLHYDFCKEK